VSSSDNREVSMHLKQPIPWQLGGEVGKLIGCCLGIYACFLYWGVLQERIMSVGKFPSPQALNLSQNLFGALWAGAILWISGKDTGRTPQEWHMFVALSGVVGSSCGYGALKFISFPTKELAKSAKCIPTMVIGTLIYKKQYLPLEYLCVIMVCAGVAAFMLLKQHKPGHRDQDESMSGLVLVGINLVLDGFTNSSQDYMRNKYDASAFQMMFFMNLWSGLYTVCYLISPYGGLDEVASALADSLVCRDVLLFGLLGALGQTVIFYTIVTFSSLTLSLITTTRKLFTLVASIILFGHIVSFGQWFGVVAVFAGLGGKIYLGSRKEVEVKKQR